MVRIDVHADRLRMGPKIMAVETNIYVAQSLRNRLPYQIFKQDGCMRQFDCQLLKQTVT